MWDITIYLMHLVDYIQSQKDKKTCKICNYIARKKDSLIYI
jgi:hypothetical protein